MSEQNPDQVIDDVMQMEERNRQALSLLLERQREKDGHLFALSTRMGETSSYITTVTLAWVAQNVHFAGDLPIFKGKVDKITKKISVDESTISDIQQRQPDWRRQRTMSLYLALRMNHKFLPLLVAGYQDWVYNSNAEQWGLDKRAMQNSLAVTSLEPKAIYYDLDIKGTRYYALDGQHRLMAILGLHELLTRGRLYSLDVNGKPKSNNSITREEIIQQIQKESGEDEGTILNRLQRLMSERIGMEIVPAVAEGETYEEALFRLRDTFVDVNENAKKLTRGDLILLDENEGFRIIARNIMVSHNLLKGKILQKRGQINETSECYTSLETLVEIAKNYIGTKTEFSPWTNPRLGDRSLGFMRPDESELLKGTRTLSSYFDALKKLPSHIRLLQGKQAGDIRKKDGEDNILFRPIAQMALARAIAILESENGMSLEKIINRIARQEDAGQLKLRDPMTPWFGVLCDPLDEKMRRKKEHQDLCFRLFCYLLGDKISRELGRAKLQKDFADARRISDNEAINTDGKRVNKDKVRLPSPWR